MEAILRDMKLVGTTSTAGGRFANVRVTGEAVLTGDTECRRFACVGNFAVKGSLQADAIRFTGNGNVEGSLNVSQMTALGELDVSGAVRGDRLKVTGELKTRGNCEAESLDVSGVFNIGGMLHAEQLNVKMYGPCRAAEIGGGTVRVKRSRAEAVKKMFGLSTTAELAVDLIEGDTVDVEHTRAAVIRGHDVTLGPGCVVARVEYRGSLKVSADAKVTERVLL